MYDPLNHGPKPIHRDKRGGVQDVDYNHAIFKAMYE